MKMSSIHQNIQKSEKDIFNQLEIKERIPILTNSKEI